MLVQGIKVHSAFGLVGVSEVRTYPAYVSLHSKLVKAPHQGPAVFNVTFTQVSSTAQNSKYFIFRV